MSVDGPSDDPRGEPPAFRCSWRREAFAAASVLVSGELDGLSTPADILESRAQLPPGTEFTEVPGAVHAFFGDYGPQAGDGTPTTSRPEAQRRIVEATQAFVDGLAPAGG